MITRGNGSAWWNFSRNDAPWSSQGLNVVSLEASVTTASSRGARARSAAAGGAASGEAVGSVGQRQAELLGQRGQPGEHVAQLVQLVGRRPLTHRPGQLAHLLGEP